MLKISRHAAIINLRLKWSIRLGKGAVLDLYLGGEIMQSSSDVQVLIIFEA